MIVLLILMAITVLIFIALVLLDKKEVKRGGYKFGDDIDIDCNDIFYGDNEDD